MITTTVILIAFSLFAIFESSATTCVVFFCCFLAGLQYLRFRYYNRKTLELNRIRTRVSSDLHDDIGASLTQIAVLLEVLRRQSEQENPQIANALSTIAHISSEAVDAIADIVWTTNPQHDSLLNLVRRMRRFASELLPAAGIEFSLQAPNSEADRCLDAELRRQVFLIFKESVNNLVRHSGCTYATIDIRHTKTELTLKISDNGHGFDLTASVEGNGLKSLRRRARSLGAKFVTRSECDGTTVFLCVPLTHSIWRSFWQGILDGSQRAEVKFSTLMTTVNTYLNRGVTRLRSQTTLRLSTTKRLTK